VLQRKHERVADAVDLTKKILGEIWRRSKFEDVVGLSQKVRRVDSDATCDRAVRMRHRSRGRWWCYQMRVLQEIDDGMLRTRLPVSSVLTAMRVYTSRKHHK
jgi:radical SAM superfamily enzyme with C-terminal helix-hairpin-helix motif